MAADSKNKAGDPGQAAQVAEVLALTDRLLQRNRRSTNAISPMQLAERYATKPKRRPPPPPPSAVVEATPEKTPALPESDVQSTQAQTTPVPPTQVQTTPVQQTKVQLTKVQLTKVQVTMAPLTLSPPSIEHNKEPIPPITVQGVPDTLDTEESPFTLPDEPPTLVEPVELPVASAEADMAVDSVPAEEDSEEISITVTTIPTISAQLDSETPTHGQTTVQPSDKGMSSLSTPSTVALPEPGADNWWDDLDALHMDTQFNTTARSTPPTTVAAEATPSTPGEAAPTEPEHEEAAWDETEIRIERPVFATQPPPLPPDAAIPKVEGANDLIRDFDSRLLTGESRPAEPPAPPPVEVASQPQPVVRQPPAPPASMPMHSSVVDDDDDLPPELATELAVEPPSDWRRPAPLPVIEVPTTQYVDDEDWDELADPTAWTAIGHSLVRADELSSIPLGEEDKEEQSPWPFPSAHFVLSRIAHTAFAPAALLRPARDSKPLPEALARYQQDLLDMLLVQDSPLAPRHTPQLPPRSKTENANRNVATAEDNAAVMGALTVLDGEEEDYPVLTDIVSDIDGILEQA